MAQQNGSHSICLRLQEHVLLNSKESCHIWTVATPDHPEKGSLSMSSTNPSLKPSPNPSSALDSLAFVIFEGGLRPKQMNAKSVILWNENVGGALSNCENNLVKGLCLDLTILLVQSFFLHTIIAILSPGRTPSNHQCLVFFLFFLGFFSLSLSLFLSSYRYTRGPKNVLGSLRGA